MGYKTKFERLASLVTEYLKREDEKREWLNSPRQDPPYERFEQYARITNAIRDKKEEITKFLNENYERD